MMATMATFAGFLPPFQKLRALPHGRGIEIGLETVSIFWSRFGPADRPLRGSSRGRCRNTNAGPMALTASTLAMLSASISASDFSGRSSLGARMPLAIRIVSKVLSRPPTNNSTLEGSVISKPSAHRDSLVTSAPFAARASQSAAPIPPEAPMTRAQPVILPSICATGGNAQSNAAPRSSTRPILVAKKMVARNSDKFFAADFVFVSRDPSSSTVFPACRPNLLISF